ncbi:hypothetical protein SASPL_147557 [Salvia splendens]|uniref:Uncharacterized protein n=1 Tax=Salvia splendens TaxID=180675 RepID=A0A8X8WFF5_SALSN|nr:hypothetical protein SASPL_147557 [Salvia splendens]
MEQYLQGQWRDMVDRAYTKFSLSANANLTQDFSLSPRFTLAFYLRSTIVLCRELLLQNMEQVHDSLASINSKGIMSTQRKLSEVQALMEENLAQRTTLLQSSDENLKRQNCQAENRSS